MRTRLEAFERGLGGTEMMLALDALHRPLQSLDQIGRGRAFDHGESVVADPARRAIEWRCPPASRFLPVGAAVAPS